MTNGAPGTASSDQATRLTAGIVLLFGFVYLVCEFVSAAAWVDPTYDWARNYISDLGFSGCEAVEGIRLCSPLHVLMNAGFVVQGTVFGIGSVLVTRLMLSPGRFRMLVRVLMVASGAGTVLVGVFHLSVALTASGFGWVHFAVATVAIGPGDLGIVLLGVAAARRVEWRGYGITVAVIGVLGLISAALLVAKVDFGLGVGVIERIAVYPLNVWTIGTGVGLLVLSASEGIRRHRARQQLRTVTG